ncbi:sulfurtransferase complex subunit TusD [Shewanella gaetbuli]|uniref:Sulfurtransferase complex subunit TusD n=1 Tax=Shewanella gaetbuli TaxID=220752 RepID=A0A9X1ZRA8_9GAMM|nr:sulfurtransferase complex subunit TusD [Shewanella gaetbuli]MCL1144157.1 sulfurtransferase complex subunit TusD [Shewanella gaetbuli]
MKKFIIQVNGPAYGSTSSYKALQYCQAVIAAGHQIEKVFFYQDGVTNSSSLNCPASDEVNLYQLWLRLANEHNVPLINCVSAALRRGVLSQQDAYESNKAHWNVDAPFVMGGLGELVTGIEQADRFVSF